MVSSKYLILKFSLFQTTSVYLQRFSIFIKSERHGIRKNGAEPSDKKRKQALFIFVIRKYRMVMEFKNGDEFPLTS